MSGTAQSFPWTTKRRFSIARDGSTRASLSTLSKNSAAIWRRPCRNAHKLGLQPQSILGDGHRSCVASADGCQDGIAVCINGWGNMTQQQAVHTGVLGEFANGMRRRVQAVENGGRTGRIEHHAVEYQQVGSFGDAAQRRQALRIDV